MRVVKRFEFEDVPDAIVVRDFDVALSEGASLCVPAISPNLLEDRSR
jgi:hypothetical protein